MDHSKKNVALMEIKEITNGYFDNSLNMDQGWNYFELVLVKKTSKIRKQSKVRHHEKINRKIKGIRTKR